MKFCKSLALGSIAFLIGSTLSAQVKLPRLIRDSMILQRDAPVNIWGWASKNEKIKIIFNNKIYRTVADDAGKWKAILPPTNAGGPYSMRISGAVNSIALKEILLGDVWFCTGQSNMVHQMQLHSVRYASDIANANYPQIRHFLVSAPADMQQKHDDLPGGYWKSANPNDVLDFSAVAYFFALQIFKQYHVPIGLINASVGGTPIEAWMSEESFTDFPSIQSTIQKNKDTAYVNGMRRNVSGTNHVQRPKSEDKGMIQRWYDPAYIPKGWRNIAVPGYWEDQGIKELDGVVWYRKEIEIPRTMSQQAARLFLGRIVDADNVYINGTMIGNTGYMYPQRRYTVPAGLLHEGKNSIVVRVQNNANKGGFVPDKPYYIFSGKDTVDLKGYWQYKVGEVYSSNRNMPGGNSINIQNQPTALFNAMLAPAIHYSCKGYLWYQGESNTGAPLEYEKLQKTMIADWRKQWHQPDAPFLFVQLPGFMDMNYQPSESQWAQFRNAQLKTLATTRTGMAVAIDLGEWNDIHPDRKKEVGDRLALQARKIAYDEKTLVASGPLYSTASIEGNKITIGFSETGSGLTTSDGEDLRYFSIAGADKKFVWANALIVGNKVQVWNDQISHPKYVRYAWADNPDGANLINQEGLPASPFTTEE